MTDALSRDRHDYCGGCEGVGSHRRHCKRNPAYTREAEWADQAETLGDRIGPNNMAAANSCYRAAGLLRRQQNPTNVPNTPGPRTIVKHIEWVAAGEPKMCSGLHGCGHEHYPRVPEPNFPARAPQWGYCEDEECGCTSLRQGTLL